MIPAGFEIFCARRRGPVLVALFAAVPLSVFAQRIPLRVLSDQPSPARLAAIDTQRASAAMMGASVERQRTAARIQAAAARRQRFAPSARLSEWRVATTGFAPVQPPGVEPNICDRVPENLLQTYIAAAAASEGLPPVLLRAIIERESSFRPCAYSNKGAMGLMQLMPATAADVGLENPFDPRDNIASGAKYLRLMLSRFGNLPAALAAYHAGPARVEKSGGTPPFAITAAYVDGILGKLSIARPLTPAGEFSNESEFGR